MIGNEMADAVIKAAHENKKQCDKECHEYRTSYNQPLGYHVIGVFESVVGIDHSLPYNNDLMNCDDEDECRKLILELAK